MNLSSKQAVAAHHIVVVILGITGDLAIRHWPEVFGSESILVEAVLLAWMGGGLVAMRGLVRHLHDWDPEMILWHVTKPWISAAAGLLAFHVGEAGVTGGAMSPLVTAIAAGAFTDAAFQRAQKHVEG